MALWRDSKGAWRAVEDRCPHRLAPLSEGRLESDGTLQCAYHGWQFDGRGACTHIPQLRGDDKAQQVACASRRSCVRAFPVQEVHGLLWVLPDSSEQAWEKGSGGQAQGSSRNVEQGLAKSPSGAPKQWQQYASWFVRDLPLRYDTTTENLIDPTHIFFAHHGIMGNRAMEQGTQMTVDAADGGGFRATYNMTGRPGTVIFQAPCLTRYEAGPAATSIYAVPTKPGWTRVFHGYVRDPGFQPGDRWPAWQRPWRQYISNQTWAEHIRLRHPIFDGDTHFLHVQERQLLGEGNDWRRSFYMPAPGDRSVVALRKWLDELGGAVPTCEPGTPMPPQMTKRQTIDRYAQHTAHCRHCSEALRNTERGMAAAAVAGVVAAVWLVARALVGAPLLAPATALGAAAVVVCGLLVRALAGLREQFVNVSTATAEQRQPTGEGLASSPQPQPAVGSFPWLSQWYPVGLLTDLDPRRPHATHLLGIPMALWRDSKGAWRAVEDRCPHRLAPLSEGRLESDGTLQCAYHGWQFDGRGACTHIPQLRGDDKAQQVACASRRSCVRAFPVQEVHGLLWVLPDSSEQAWEKGSGGQAQVSSHNAEQGQGPAESPSGAPKQWQQYASWFVRDLPLRYDTTTENLIDPTHVFFAHHGVMGNRAMEQGTQMTVDAADGGGFTAAFNMTGRPGTVTFQAPCLTRYDIGPFATIIYAVPTKPGWSRVFHGYLRDPGFQPGDRWPAWQRPWRQYISNQTWAEHIRLRHPIFDGDTHFLHVQERQLLGEGNDWRRSFYMPAPGDRSVVALRKWLDELGGAVPTCEPGTPMPPQMTKRQTIDRYAQHTAHCRHCSEALRNTERGMAAAAVAGVVAAVWLVARALVGAPLLAPATALGAAAVVVCGLLVRALAGLREQFVYVDYVHADKH
ncbi:hypothetical protein HYH03_010970 [Edaphochlamys debaryana]|uniref:Rieske domain-containing protein n=1 Tax=Edaphochlamys debaryana TaxID=47281 RepID=A0A835XUW6_9CHLO|nr:hypothetical protein HYH03_010970 [Edaphochlamys debaryana]|eukprot:KAG2490576.1 hypothetical protein HYH03_010970 [Edaphochlamys debaryana]